VRVVSSTALVDGAPVVQSTAFALFTVTNGERPQAWAHLNPAAESPIATLQVVSGAHVTGLGTGSCSDRRMLPRSVHPQRVLYAAVTTASEIDQDCSSAT